MKKKKLPAPKITNKQLAEWLGLPQIEELEILLKAQKMHDEEIRKVLNAMIYLNWNNLQPMNSDQMLFYGRR